MGKRSKDTGKYNSTNKFMSLILRHHPDAVGIGLVNSDSISWNFWPVSWENFE